MMISLAGISERIVGSMSVRVPFAQSDPEPARSAAFGGAKDGSIAHCEVELRPGSKVAEPLMTATSPKVPGK